MRLPQKKVEEHSPVVTITLSINYKAIQNDTSHNHSTHIHAL